MIYSDNTKCNTPAPHSHLRPCILTSHMTPGRENVYWAQFGCVELFWGETHLHCYTSCTLTTLHCSKVSFLQCCHMKRYNKIFFKCEGCTHFCEILYMIHIYIYIYIIYIYIYYYYYILTYCISCIISFYDFITPKNMRFINKLIFIQMYRLYRLWNINKTKEKLSDGQMLVRLVVCRV